MTGLRLLRNRQHLTVAWASDDEWFWLNELGDLGARPVHVHPGHAGPIPTSRPSTWRTILPTLDLW